ncbi:MAG: chromosome segregation protein SMC [Elusimicrobia bacterium RIFCSPLOWO2_02_FULL_39_32]|nr:MAG: chromosome segregation protein SMC [Elusimicrobia bacterium RIFCSPHIGHO2_02_FULL_39_36]OGR92780.1 MAG: chromosome segregation protein SMC [Elusimicrobia bacterium RIFCSPLOWO2_02_FULL_39_32]OGR99565.1 MAG: chromosome segregation protein SMC [Elusimicrobia bacterium RIFCSPLOWO2_12_FULL_39_28]
MQLKTIEMVGFKSFANKTVIDFKEGITAVVGPNGCGKSNIVDAFRWCLGEMSAKSLRSKQMLDVVFAGSTGKAPMNLAEVTLTFDNTHHLLPIDFTEVEVTRKLFRSGESEYFLNQTQCRLKDIRDLFLDTGIGEGYSILAQGEVDFVINAKAEERRELFEEAAGISKYKVRREEALRKLEKVELDLSRLNDILFLIKEQMDSLEAAAKKAQNFQKIKEELKNKEVSFILNQCQTLEQEILSKQNKSDEFRKEIEQTTTNSDLAEAEWTQNRLIQDGIEKELYDNNSTILKLDKEMYSADQQLKNSLEREQELLQKEKKLEEQIQQNQNELSHVQEKLKTSETELNEFESKESLLKESFLIEKNQWQSKEDERKKLESSKKEILEMLFQLNMETTELKNELNKLSSLSSHKELEVLSNQKELDKCSTEETKLSSELKEAENAVKILTSKEEELFQEQASLEKNFNLLQTEQEKEQELYQTLEKKIIQLEAQSKILTETFLNHPYKKGTEAILKKGFPGLKGVVGLLLKVSKNSAQWIEALLGNKLNFLVFERLEDAEAALNWIKENRMGRACCFILEKIPTINLPHLQSLPNANSLLQFVQCDPELNPLKNYLLGSAFLRGNTLYDRALIDGGSDSILSEAESQESIPSHSSSLSQNQFKLKEDLNQESVQLKLEIETSGKRCQELEGSLKKSREDLNQKGLALEKSRLEKKHFQEIFDSKNEQWKLLSRELEWLKEQIQSNQNAAHETKEKINVIEEKINKGNLVLKDHEQKRMELDCSIEAKKEEEHSFQLKSKEAEIRLENFLENLTKKKEVFQGWRAHFEEYQKNIETAKLEIKEGQSQLKNCQLRQKESSQKVIELEAEKEKISSGAENLLNKKREMEESNLKIQESLHALRETHKTLSELLHQIELNLRTLEAEKNNHLNRLQETYALNFEQAKENFSLQETISVEEVDRLKKKVESLSNSVNLEAPEQYKNLQDRFSFLNTQIQDLLKAKEDLRGAIFEINRTTKDQFKQTYLKVRENFQEVYSQLFVGGVADLLLTDESNILESGVEIVAQPAGKKLQNIALLSGGEKTLTAIALLFAFFMVKPSPICILDEVDAPLDPANVTRYLNLVNHFSDKTQFMAVTHNPKTMEAADILYGVTMEESGISKILSVKLQKQPSQTKAELTPA